MIKSRLIKIERLVEPFRPQKLQRTWILVDLDPEKRAEEIRKGKILHPIDGDPFKEGDQFMEIKIVNVRPERGGSPADLEAALYRMAKGERIPAPDNGRPPNEAEIDELKKRAAEIEKALSESGQ